MKRVSWNSLMNVIVKKRTLVEKIFIIGVLLAIICFPFVKVNYDMAKYLPESAPSKQGIHVLTEEFGYPGMARIMIKDVSLYEAKAMKDRIQAIKGVDMVLWLDTMQQIYQPITFYNEDLTQTYYKDHHAVMDIIFSEEDASPVTRKALIEIEKITGDKGFFSGTAVDNKTIQEAIMSEVSTAMVLVITMILVILCLTTTSWFEPILFMLVIGIAIVLNLGSNLFLGEISFFTFSVAAILQLAIAMDYSIFLLHSFGKEKEKGGSAEEAMIRTLEGSSRAILSSGVTTIVGFLALALMEFTIGKDMGIVLAKGIILSLLTVMFLMPALILRWEKRIERTSHKPFMPSFTPLGKVLYKARIPVLILALLLILPAYTAQSMNHFLYGNDALSASEGTKVYEDTQAINERFGRSNLALIMIPKDAPVKEKRLAEEIEKLEVVNYVQSLSAMLPPGLSESFLPSMITGQFRSKHYARVLVSIRTAGESDLAFETVEKLTALTKQFYPEDSYITGLTPATKDMKEIIKADYDRVNILSLIGIGIVLWITFKSLRVALLLIVPIQIAIYMNMALPYLSGETIIFIGYIIVGCLQLGATIDYAILLTNNYLKARKEVSKKEAFISCISESSLSILTSGTILTCVGYGLYLTSSITGVAEIGRLIGRGALLSMLLVLGVLPTLLTVSDRFIKITRCKGEMTHEETI